MGQTANTLYSLKILSEGRVSAPFEGQMTDPPIVELSRNLLKNLVNA